MVIKKQILLSSEMKIDRTLKRGKLYRRINIAILWCL